MRTVVGILTALVIATPAAAQGHSDHAAAGGGAFPQGWQARLDRANANPANIRFVAQDDGYHITTGPATLLYRPADTARGNFRVVTEFTVTKQPQHPEAYGIFVGGQNLDAETQSYLYFLVRHDGQFLIKRRTGAQTSDIQAWTAHAAVRKPDANGGMTNALRLEAGPERVRFIVNDTEVASFARADLPPLEGVAGLRVNHNLDVHVGDFSIRQ